MSYKIVTMSLDPQSISRLEQLMVWRHDTKSGIIRQLVDQEYRRQIQMKEEAEPN